MDAPHRWRLIDDVPREIPGLPPQDWPGLAWSWTATSQGWDRTVVVVVMSLWASCTRGLLEVRRTRGRLLVVRAMAGGRRPPPVILVDDAGRISSQAHFPWVDPPTGPRQTRSAAPEP